MATRKPSIKKPTINKDEALKFATETGQEGLQSAQAQQRGGNAGQQEIAPQQPSSEPEKSKSGQIPQGDVRLTANIRADLHLKLKIAAANRRTTIGEIIEELIEKNL